MIFRFNQTLRLLAIAGIVGSLTACGGGGGSSVQTLPNSDGALISSYIAKATVTLDINDDGVCGDNEPKVVSDMQGHYSFPGLGLHMVCSDGGYNTTTNLPVVGQLKAPAGAEVVTPLSTLVVALTQTTPGQAPTPEQTAAAQAKLETQLGLPAGAISLDPMAVSATQPKIEQINSAVQVLLQTVATSVTAFAGVQAPDVSASGSEKKALDAVFANAAVAVATVLTTPNAAPVDLTSTSATNAAAFVQSVVETTVTKVQSDPAAIAAVQAAAPSEAAANITTLSPVNASAFVASGVATLVQAVATASDLDAAKTQAQSNVTIVNAVNSVVDAAPGLFVAVGNQAPASSSDAIAALAEVVLPSTSVSANTAVVVDTTALNNSLTAAATATGATIDTTSISTAIASAVENPPAPPAPVDIGTVPTPVVPPLPEPIVVTGAIGG